MSLLGLIIFGVIIYYIFKHVREIGRTLFGSSTRPNATTGNRAKQRVQPGPQTESGNRIIKDDEGEYVDFEEVKGNPS